MESSKRFDKCQAYIASQVRRAEKEGKRPAKNNPAITISRECGAGANTLSEKLSDYLNEKTKDPGNQWTVFDKNLVKQVLEDHDLPKRLERFMPEDKTSRVEDTIGDMLGVHPPSWDLIKLTHNTIYRLAKMGQCIIIGRGGNIITRDLPNVLHLRLVGSVEKRKNRCMEYYGLTEDKALERMKKEDRARRRYLLGYYDEEIDDPVNYHMVINTDRVTTDSLVELIGNMI